MENARNDHAPVTRRPLATSTSPEVLLRGADESRLLASGRITHLPGVSQWYQSARQCPLQWRGRTGFTPVSVAPVRESVIWRSYPRLSARASAKIIAPPSTSVSPTR